VGYQGHEAAGYQRLRRAGKQLRCAKCECMIPPMAIEVREANQKIWDNHSTSNIQRGRGCIDGQLLAPLALHLQVVEVPQMNVY
jgi:hypothetical protein